ncbi:hypothetical protein CCUS01_09598 [Colletotrichum cuscutae]|uniref:Uncharacterized protein n=1 Tax=Colletotrichum cuscutae TaxID=1209917 RepID=A0AAI9UGE9_9PEZI|nr:hypothetical protein CCUS01_09598 [Colletotrichum cuscutae]
MSEEHERRAKDSMPERRMETAAGYIRAGRHMSPSRVGPEVNADTDTIYPGPRHHLSLKFLRTGRGGRYSSLVPCMNGKRVESADACASGNVVFVGKAGIIGRHWMRSHPTIHPSHRATVGAVPKRAKKRRDGAAVKKARTKTWRKVACRRKPQAQNDGQSLLRLEEDGEAELESRGQRRPTRAASFGIQRASRIYEPYGPETLISPVRPTLRRYLRIRRTTKSGEHRSRIGENLNDNEGLSRCIMIENEVQMPIPAARALVTAGMIYENKFALQLEEVYTVLEHPVTTDQGQASDVGWGEGYYVCSNIVGKVVFIYQLDGRGHLLAWPEMARPGSDARARERTDEKNYYLGRRIQGAAQDENTLRYLTFCCKRQKKARTYLIRSDETGKRETDMHRSPRTMAGRKDRRRRVKEGARWNARHALFLDKTNENRRSKQTFQFPAGPACLCGLPASPSLPKPCCVGQCVPRSHSHSNHSQLYPLGSLLFLPPGQGSTYLQDPAALQLIIRLVLTEQTSDIYIASSIPGHQRFCIIIDSFCQSLPHTILYRLWHGLPCFGLSPDTTLKILHRVSLPAFHHKERRTRAQTSGEASVRVNTVRTGWGEDKGAGQGEEKRTGHQSSWNLSEFPRNWLCQKMDLDLELTGYQREPAEGRERDLNPWKRCVSSLLNVRAGSNIRRGRCSTTHFIWEEGVSPPQRCPPSMSCRTALLTSSLPLFHVGVFASFTAPVNIDQFRVHAGHGITWQWFRAANHNGSRRYGRARDMDTQPNTRIPDTSVPRP